MQRRTLALLLGVILVCAWCCVTGGAAGWFMGYDLARRETRAELLPESGVLVVRVLPESPAARAGIDRGSTIIALDNVPVEDVSALRNALSLHHPGDRVNITFRAELAERTVQVELARSPADNKPYLGVYYTARADEPADL